MPHQSPHLLIGVSARIYYPNFPVLDLGGVWTRTLHYLEQSVAQWVMRGGALPVMVPAVEAQSLGPIGRIEREHFAQALDGLLLQGGNDLVGRYLKRGDLVGYVVGADDPVLRVVVPQSQIDLVRARRGDIEIRFAGDLASIRPAAILREAPAAQMNIPSATLTTDGGGEILIDPRDPNKSRALEGLFFVDLRITDGKPVDRLGERVFVRFDHGTEPIAFRLMRAVRQVFLSRFGL